MKDEPAAFIVCICVLVVVGFGMLAFGRSLGAIDACATIHAEWRGGKCVRVVVEEVK